jgi:hypothetical protein
MRLIQAKPRAERTRPKAVVQPRASTRSELVSALGDLVFQTWLLFQTSARSSTS